MEHDSTVRGDLALTLGVEIRAVGFELVELAP